MSKFNIKLKKYRTEGHLNWEYNPFHNMSKVMKSESESSINLEDFDTDKLQFDVSHPVDIECQPAYDGSVNLILNDDLNVPRIINSGFTVKEDNTYERVKRNQEKQTNIYNEEYVDSETRLQRTTNEESQFLKISLEKIETNGELPGGNYVFFVRYADDDKNETRIICESGIVTIYNGGIKKHGVDPSGVYGTLLNEKTNKSIKLIFSNIDKSFTKMKIGYKRSYCDLNGIIQDEYKVFSNLYRIPSGKDSFSITIDGREKTDAISFGDVVKQYNTYHKVKTQTQVQDILFFGNVEEKVENISLLQSLSYYVQVKAVFDKQGIGRVSVNDFDVKGAAEYYDPKNIYNKLGYFPEEYYRLGIVYIYNDDSVSGVYNLRGCVLELDKWNTEEDYVPELSPNHNELFINNSTDNTKGVFKMPDILISINSDNVKPLILKTRIPKQILLELEKENIKGYYFVRQPRIPIFIAQAYSIGVSTNAYVPMLTKTNDSGNVDFLIQTPVKDNYTLGKNVKSYQSDALIKGLACADVMLKPQLQSLLDGSEFKLKPVAKYQFDGDQNNGLYIARINNAESINNNVDISEKLIYVPENTSVKTYEGTTFSTKSGSAEDVRSLRNVKWPFNNPQLVDENSVRGNFMPFIGICNENDELEPNTVYNIYTSSYGATESSYKTQIKTRSTDKSSYTSISNRLPIKTVEKSEVVYNDIETNIYRGDCFININSIKVQSNFLDYQTPLNDKIVDPLQLTKVIWKDKDQKILKTYSEWTTEDWTKLNISDWNVVDLASLLVYKSISNYNLCSRTIDSQNVDEISLFGDVRKFYPHNKKVGGGIAWKIPESTLVNSGNSVTATIIPHFEVEQVPYIKNTFDNRIAFSNYSVNNAFSNGYRVFTGLSYQDIDRQYGAIVKLLPFGADLFCIFEHGCGIIPVNQKALIQTTQGQSVHMYGAGVLQSQVTVVSQDYGSIWEDSIISTPNGIYGVDTFAKKIWKYDGKVFSLISDQLVQRFLNENITLNDSDFAPMIALKNVKTHYNNFKGDVMFTFYKDDKVWNLCYNERIGKFVTRYSWTPLLSGNIQNSFVSIDRTPVEIYSLIGKNSVIENGLKPVDSNLYEFELKESSVYDGPYYLNGVQVNSPTENVYKYYGRYQLCGFNNMYDAAKASIRSIEYPEYIKDEDKVIIHEVTNNSENCFWSEFGGNNDFLDTFVLGWDEKTDFVESEIPDKIVDPADDPEESDVVDDEEEMYINSNRRLNQSLLNFQGKFKNFILVEYGGNLVLRMKLSKFIPWIKVNLVVTPVLEKFKEDGEWTISNKTYGQPFKQTLCLLADYDDLNYKIDKYISENSKNDDKAEEYRSYVNYYNDICRINLYTHGRAGNYSEINYSDDDPDNQIKPTFWYNRQEPFEFEFVVNEPSGLQKIFDNLVIISNNAEPESLEFSLIGDAYDFNKAGIFASDHTTPTYDSKTGILDEIKFKNDKSNREYFNGKIKISQLFKNLFSNNSICYSTNVEKDEVTNQYHLKVSDNCRNVKDNRYGRRLGNIEYRDDKWLVNISPIYYKNKYKNNDLETICNSISSTKLRDKWVKIRIKYKGDKLVVISAIQTLMTLSYS